jgi:amino acid permease
MIEFQNDYEKGKFARKVAIAIVIAFVYGEISGLILFRKKSTLRALKSALKILFFATFWVVYFLFVDSIYQRLKQNQFNPQPEPQQDLQTEEQHQPQRWSQPLSQVSVVPTIGVSCPISGPCGRGGVHVGVMVRPNIF